jgi:hypothetical protein
MRRFIFNRMAWAVLTGVLSVTALATPPQPVELTFRPPASEDNPFARDLRAEVITPSGKSLQLPAFFLGDGLFAVRARADETGQYRLGPVMETKGGVSTPLAITPTTRDGQSAREIQLLPQVTGFGGRPARLLLGNGQTYVPVGANVAWAESGRVDYHLHALAEFGREGLNWMRIWMAHWTALNLDWLPPDLGKSPAPGALDLRVAADWDRIVAAAEEHGVYLQIVLQHHGQYSTSNDSNWKENPWNAANPGGFLQKPAEFFTSPVARRITELKYRYIVARWGYSPAVLSWELFNEVHWTDAFRLEHDEAVVARWHAEMAAYLRSVDPYHHLVTTSTENLHSPIYAQLDYFQPHNYASNLLAGPRAFQVPPDELDRPVFYGEMGDDHATISKAQKDSGIAIVPPVWASVMGQGRYPGQPWLGWDLLRTGRLAELGAVARFLAATGLGARDGLVPFSPTLDCAVKVPLVVEAGEAWQREAAPEITLPLDGREPVELARVPATYVGAPESIADGYPARVTYHVNFSQEATLHARVSGVDAKAREAAIAISVDGREVARKSWAAHASDSPTGGTPVEIPFSVAAGRHTIVVENPGVPGWFELSGIDFGVEIPVIAAVGRRGPDFIAVWLWHRTGVFALVPPAAVGGTLKIDDVPAGVWRVTWWDTLKGVPAAASVVTHAGGRLEIPVPPIDRQAAVVLTR